jgi:hypothetical protein
MHEPTPYTHQGYQRHFYEPLQGDSIVGGERGDSLNFRPKDIPIEESQQGVPIPQWQRKPQGTSPLMSIPLINQIAPFVLALVETAAQAQPGTFDAMQPESLAPGSTISGPGSNLQFTTKKGSTWERPEVPDYGPPPNGPLERALKETWGNLEGEGATGMMDFENNGGMTNNQAIIQRVVDQYNAQARQGREDIARRKVTDNDREEDFQQMTLAQWNALTPEQQASAQFNQNLQAAVQRDTDMRLQMRPTAEQREAYQTGVRSLFPQNSTTYMLDYAPETLGLLETLDLEPALLANTSMDDFLKLDVAITPQQMMNLDRELEPKFQPTGYQTTPSGMSIPTGEIAYDNPREERLALAQGLAAAQHQMNQSLLQDELEKGQRVLTTMTGAMANQSAAADFGAVARQPLGADNRISTDGLKQLTAEDMAMFIETLAHTPGKLDTTVSQINEEFDLRGSDQAERDAVYENLRNYAEQAALGNAEWWPGKTATPQQVAMALGSVPLKRG